MPSETDICNLALDRLGQAPISSMSQTTGNGPVVSRNYYQERDALLRETHWTFARSEITLTQLSENTWQNWAFAYAYPPDCLKIQYLCNPNLVANFPGYPYEPPLDEFTQHNCPHEITQALDAFGNPTGGKVILTNLEAAVLVYTKQVSDTALFPASFTSALILRVSRAICHRLLPNSPILRDLALELQGADAMAKRDAAAESVEWMARKSDIEKYRR
jgi:hypothetical protein